MINYIWFFLIFFGIIFGILSGNGGAVSKTILDSGTYSVKLVIELCGILCIWSGIIKIAEESGLNSFLSGLIKPVIKRLFKNINSKALEYISLNLTANMLGLGNAATPLGIKAMEEMEITNKNKDELSDDMVLFLVLNAAAIQLIPTTIISIRAALGSKIPSAVIVPIIIISAITAVIGAAITKILEKFF
ncbi:MAG: spore maturation protein [Bacillota bacterium]|nr:spore maturation protein [Bacillota bacterium]